MDSKGYLKHYGWEEGEALKKGGLKKPILVKHKKDKKGLGCAPHQDDKEAWWERLFDGQLKSLDIKSNEGSGITFEQKEVMATAISKENSPLYRWFVKGEGLRGTIDNFEKREKICSVVVSGLKRKSEWDERSSKKLRKTDRKTGVGEATVSVSGKDKKEKKKGSKEKKEKKEKKKEKKEKKKEKKEKKK